MCSLSQTPLIACINSLFRHCKQNYCLKLIIHEGYTLTCVCQCIHFVPYVLKVSSRGESHGVDLHWNGTNRWCSREPRSLVGILSVSPVTLMSSCYLMTPVKRTGGFGPICNGQVNMSKACQPPGTLLPVSVPREGFLFSV